MWNRAISYPTYEFSGKRKLDNLSLLVGATRPVWTRALDFGLMLFEGFIVYLIASAFWLLGGTAVGIADAYHSANSDARAFVIETLTGDLNFTGGILIMMALGLPLLLLMIYLTASQAHNPSRLTLKTESILGAAPTGLCVTVPIEPIILAVRCKV